MSVLWTADAFATAAGGTFVNGTPAGIANVSIDSRTIGAGDAFVAIKGPNHDGHDFASAALSAGAACALVQRSRTPDGTGPLLVVPDDPLGALERIGTAARARIHGSVLAVTGSVGKTGTKEMLRLGLSSLGPTHSPVGSFNNHWGVPLTLSRMPAETQFAVFEIGMSGAGEIRPLTKMVSPHVAIITTVAPVHLEFFDSEEGIAEAKAEILEGLQPGGVAVLNRDNHWFDLLSKRAREQDARIVTFGGHASADVRLEHVSLGDEGSSVKAVVAGEPVIYRLGAPGRHLVQNSLAVLAACHALGADLTRVMLSLAEFRAPRGRGEQIQLDHAFGPFTLIDESYNANPASTQAALALLGQAQPEGRGRRIAVLGDMRELGEDGPALHRGLLPAVEEASVDLVFLAGPLMHNLWEDLPHRRRGAYAATAAELQPILFDAIGPGDVVMIKASLATKFGPVVEDMKRHFAGQADKTGAQR